MILQALARYYDILRNDPGMGIAPPGYSTVGVSHALNLSEEGELLDIFPLFDRVQRGRKFIEIPRRMVVPARVKRSSGIAPNFVCDPAVYVLGLAEQNGGAGGYAGSRFAAFRQFNEALLKRADSPAARALSAFLDRYEAAELRRLPVVAAQRDGLLAGGNLVFMYRGAFLHTDPAVRREWESRWKRKTALRAQCLVIGTHAPIARLHPHIKGVRGARPTGATLVGFNAPAYESYGQSQGMNAPVSEEAVFAYTTALNFLLSPDNPHPPIRLGDTTVVYWAESDRPEYAAVFAGLFDPGEMEADLVGGQLRQGPHEWLGKVAAKLERLQALEVSPLLPGLDPDTRFYVLGLAPNAARLSVRFFITEPFGEIVARLMQHYDDLAIVKEFDQQPDCLPLYQLLGETVSRKASDPEVAPLLAGAVIRATLNEGPYPAALFNAVIARVRADQDDTARGRRKINYGRAAILKAFLIRKYRHQPVNPFREVLVMSLNEESANPAYLLGRLFAVLDKLQREAVGKVNAGIKDRYFTSACASPASVFPILLRLAQHHIAKAEYGFVSENWIEAILNRLDIERNPIPARLSLDEQGVFILGYYHQRAAFFTRTGARKLKDTRTEINDSEKESKP